MMNPKEFEALIQATRNNETTELHLSSLDIKQWTHQKSLSPLYGSLNPADEWQSLVSIPQTHWVGGKDTVVRKEVALAFAKHFPAAKKPKIIVVPAFDHVCCWASDLHLKH